MKKIFLTAFVLANSTFLLAQETFSVDANLRSRFEYRHGQGAIFQKEAKPASFVNQRMRLGTYYQKDGLALRVAGQQIFTWGDAPQPQGELSNHFGVFEAWAGIRLNENWALKLGRQVLSYDDERIFGELDWLQYGRFHDALLAEYKRNDWSSQIGLAFNQLGQPNYGNTYSLRTGNSYKTMQFIRVNKSWNGNSLSFLFLNNGFQDYKTIGTPPDTQEIQDGVSNLQTTGFYGKFPLSDLLLEASAYYQFGKRNRVDVSAYQMRLELLYKTTNVTGGIGFEALSGTSYDDTSGKNKSFTPLFGTNHKFNGHMDMYYVGSVQGRTGLNDLYGKLDLWLTEKSSLLFMPHIFMSNAKRGANVGSYLGTELDFMYTYKLRKDASLNIGYSHHLPSETLKTPTTHGTQNWFWVQLSIKPTLFSIVNN